MLTKADKKWLRGRKWTKKDLDLFEKDLRENRVEEPYVIKTIENIKEPLAEVKKIRGKQCLIIL